MTLMMLYIMDAIHYACGCVLAAWLRFFCASCLSLWAALVSSITTAVLRGRLKRSGGSRYVVFLGVRGASCALKVLCDGLRMCTRITLSHYVIQHVGLYSATLKTQETRYEVFVDQKS